MQSTSNPYLHFTRTTTNSFLRSRKFHNRLQEKATEYPTIVSYYAIYSLFLEVLKFYRLGFCHERLEFLYSVPRRKKELPSGIYPSNPLFKSADDALFSLLFSNICSDILGVFVLSFVSHSYFLLIFSAAFVLVLYVTGGKSVPINSKSKRTKSVYSMVSITLFLFC